MGPSWRNGMGRGPSKRFGTGQGTFPEVQNRSRESLESPGRLGMSSKRSGMGQEVPRRFGTGRGPSQKFGTGRETLPEARDG